MWRRSKVILPSTSGSLTEAAPMLKMMMLRVVERSGGVEQVGGTADRDDLQIAAIRPAASD